LDELPQGEAQPPEDAGATASPGGGRLLPVIGLVVALVVGGGVGFVGVSRMATPSRAASTRNAESRHPTESTPLYLIENLVVNPQGTKGARFLIVSVALQAEKPDVIDELKRLDPELRDAYGHVLSAMTIDQLSDIGGRDSLKAALKRATDRVLGPDAIADVFLPQFVLQ